MGVSSSSSYECHPTVGDRNPPLPMWHYSVLVPAVMWLTTMPIGVEPGAVVEPAADRVMCSGPTPARRGVWPRAVRADGGTA